MPLSARNRLPGIIEEVHLGTIMARVVVKVGGKPRGKRHHSRQRRGTRPEAGRFHQSSHQVHRSNDRKELIELRLHVPVDTPLVQPNHRTRQPFFNVLIVTRHHDRSSGLGLGGNQAFEDRAALLIDMGQWLVQ
jgi:hypothetical protein